MKSITKFLSVFMVLTIAFASLIIPASAADGTLDITYTVEKYTGEDTSGNTADDIYGVTVYLNNSLPINGLMFPIYYESDKFTPIDGADMSIMDWGYTIDFDAGLVRAGYVIPEGSDLADTNKYNKANVLPANRVVNARGAISGLGRSTVEAAITNLDTRNPADGTAWWGSLDSTKYGVVTLQYSGQNNFCNLQNYGVATPLITILFKRNEGLTDADVEGAMFGYVPGATVRNDASVETVETKFYYDKTSTAGIPAATANYCTVTAPSIVNPLKGQIRFDKDANGAYANTFDVRALAVITGADFTATFGNEAAAEEMIKEAGFVFANGANVTAPSMDAVKALVENGTQASGYTKKTIGFISSSVQPGDYVFSCIVNNVGDADKTNSLVAVGYIAYEKDGVTQYAYYPAAQTISFNELYTTYYGQAFPA